MDHKILFVCTGNYYRSRFAEELFNALASRHSLDWKAASRGIAAFEGGNVGPISPHVLRKLEALGVPVGTDIREPLQLEETDLAEADLVIGLDSTEHLPLMKQRFVQWADQIVYWNVPDLHLLESEDALSRIENNVTSLVQQLRTNTAPLSQGGPIWKSENL